MASRTRMYAPAGKQPRKRKHSKFMHGRHNCKFFCQERQPGCCFATEKKFSEWTKVWYWRENHLRRHDGHLPRGKEKIIASSPYPLLPSMPKPAHRYGHRCSRESVSSRHQLCLLKSKEQPKGQIFAFTLSLRSNPKSLVLHFNTSTKGDVPSSPNHGENDLAVRQGKKASLRQGHGRKIELSPTF